MSVNLQTCFERLRTSVPRLDAGFSNRPAGLARRRHTAPAQGPERQPLNNLISAEIDSGCHDFQGFSSQLVRAGCTCGCCCAERAAPSGSSPFCDKTVTNASAQQKGEPQSGRMHSVLFVL
jgi:hypothetical protein